MLQKKRKEDTTEKDKTKGGDAARMKDREHFCVTRKENHLHHNKSSLRKARTGGGREKGMIYKDKDAYNVKIC